MITGARRRKGFSGLAAGLAVSLAACGPSAAPVVDASDGEVAPAPASGRASESTPTDGGSSQEPAPPKRTRPDACLTPPEPLWSVGASNPPWASSQLRLWATRGSPPVAVSFTSTGSSGPPEVAVELFSGAGGRLHRHAPAGDVRMRPWALIGETLLLEESGALRGLDVSGGTLMERWTSPPLRQALEQLLGAGATLEERLVPDSAHSPSSALFLASDPQLRTRLARLSLGTGALTVSDPLEAALRGLLGDEDRALFANSAEGVVRIDHAGAVLWRYASPGANVEAAFDGRVFLTDGTVLDAGNGTRLYAVRGGLKDAWITRDRLYAPHACEASGFRRQCLDLRVFRAEDGSLLWSKRVEGDALSNPVVGADGSVHVLSVQVRWAQQFAEDSRVLGQRLLTFDHTGAPRPTCFTPAADLSTRLHALGPLLVAEGTYGYRGYIRRSAEAHLALPELVAPEGWMPGSGSRARDFRPE